MTTRNRVVVVLSGGQDSTTCLCMVKELGYEVHAITFDYNQRHRVEIQAARTVARLVGVASHEVVGLGPILKGTSPLVSGAELEQYADHQSLPGGIEKTFVPMRNQLFLTIAANRAFVLGSSRLVSGLCEEDFGGYPDCRRQFVDSFELTCTLGTFTPDMELGRLTVCTPLMHATKKDSVHEAMLVPGCYEALAYSHTSYDGAYPPTGKDHATLLRAKGFEEAGVPDPLVLRAHIEGLMRLPTTANYVNRSPEYEEKVRSVMERVHGWV